MRVILRSFILFIAMGLMFACSNAPEGKKAETGEASGQASQASEAAVTYKVDPSQSVVTWTGSKPTGQHMGTINITDGQLSVKGNTIEAGRFTMDMTSLEVIDDTPADMKPKLVSHLKTGDFFEAEKYPNSTFTITSVETVSGNPDVTHRITGDLKMKDVTKSVTFDANIAVGSGMVSAVTPAFTIDRTEWGINFRSGLLGTAQDKLIHDEVGLTLNLVAKK